MKRSYAVANFIAVVAVIIWNYTANTVGIKGNTVSSLSSEYFNLFTPASYAFAIWGLIYLGLLAHVIFQLKKTVFDRQGDGFILQIGPWLMVAVLSTGVWLLVWLLEWTVLSLLVMLIILISLIIIILRLNMERAKVPARIVIWVWWPISIYSGWIAVATIANFAAWLSKIGWVPVWGEITWTLIMVVVAFALNIFMVLNRNMREFALVGVWALVAISFRHWNSIPSIQWTAMILAVLLFTFIGIHGYRNREENEIFGR